MTFPSSSRPDLDVSCIFCAIVTGETQASIVAEDAMTLAFVDLRQFHPGHVLVIPRRHFPDIRNADDEIAGALLRTVARVARAVDRAFPSDGLSIWHSAGVGANQEVPHLHFHIHPRVLGDDVLRVYPTPPALPDRATLDVLSQRVRGALDQQGVVPTDSSPHVPGHHDRSP